MGRIFIALTLAYPVIKPLLPCFSEESIVTASRVSDCHFGDIRLIDNIPLQEN